MIKITQDQKKEFIKNKLATDARWAKHALLKIFEFQTEEEQVMETTCVHNKCGYLAEDKQLDEIIFTERLLKRGMSAKDIKLYKNLIQ